MPWAKSTATLVPGDGFGHVHTSTILQHTSNTELDVFEIRFETLVEHSDSCKKSAAEQDGGPGRRVDGAALLKEGPVGLAMSGPPCGGPAREDIERAIENCVLSGRKNLARGEPGVGFLGSATQCGEVVGRQLYVIVQDRNPGRGARAQTAIHREGETGIPFQAEHARSRGCRRFTSAIG